MASPALAPLLALLLGSGGLVAAFVALVKLRGEATGQAVEQARNAGEVLTDALRAAERERDYWQRRFNDAHKRAGLLGLRCAQLEQQLRAAGIDPLPAKE